MKKFRNWCNNNAGFIAFWGIAVMIIIGIISQVKIKMPETVINAIISFFIFKIKIPVYLLLITLLILIVVFYNKLGYWNKFFFKTIKSKVIEIRSDNSTIFKGSPTYQFLIEDQSSFVYRDGGYWNKFRQFPELNSSYWIAHNEMITDEEAIKGGDYNFLKEFELEVNKSRIEEAILFFTVDNHCSITVNDNLVGSYTGYDNLKKVDIRNQLVRGKNRIFFEVNNDQSPTLAHANYNSYINKKGSINPYGIKFNLRIIIK